MAVAKPLEDKDYTNHDPSAVPPIGYHDGTCEAPTEIRHDHPQLGEDQRFYCTRRSGHLGRHQALFGDGIAASWAQKR